MSTERLRWGILGTGAIASCLANAITHSRTGTLAAVGSRGLDKARAFTEKHAAAGQGTAPVAHGSYEDLLADPRVQIVYISTPHPLHAQWVIRAAEAGKHILCEKPVCVNHAQAMVAFEAARKAGVFAMEAFMYRCHPQTAKLVELVKSGTIGQVKVIQATFSFQGGFNPESRLYKNALAGGGTLDVGCYAVSAARLIAGAAMGRDFADPIEVKGSAHLGQTGVDEWAVGSLKFVDAENPAGPAILAQVATGIAANQENVVRVFGTDGSIFVANPWVADRSKGGTSSIVVRKKGQEEKIDITTDVTAFTLEVDLVGKAIAEGRNQAPAPAMSWDDSLGNIKTLDAWRASFGLTYGFEKPDAPEMKQTVAARPLHLGSNQAIPMQYGRVPGMDAEVSRLIYGCDNQSTHTHAWAVWDDFAERGGNTFDTAWVYGGGQQERMLGGWLKSRGIRAQMNIVTKGAHTPACDPDSLSRQLLESLDRLQSPSTDIYIMHRDNLNIPVDEFVDVLNLHVRQGRIKVFGGSNWTVRRIAAANAYAQRRGLQGFSILNNNFSLARMVNPVWGGCVASSDPDTRAWLTQNKLAHLAWSSQARGFFTPRADLPADKQPDKSLSRCWYSDDNFQRRARAYELATKYGVLPINIALAYVLCQPFESFALVGPRTIDEMQSTMPGLTVKLTPRELAYLNLEE